MDPNQQLNATAAQAAASAKTKALPVLQANQDPFGTLSEQLAFTVPHFVAQKMTLALTFQNVCPN